MLLSLVLAFASEDLLNECTLHLFLRCCQEASPSRPRISGEVIDFVDDSEYTQPLLPGDLQVRKHVFLLVRDILGRKLFLTFLLC